MKGPSFTFAKIVSVVLAGQIVQSSPSLRVVDTQGATVVVTNARIDYGGVLLPDVQTAGIRLQQGDAAVIAKWSAIDTIRVIGVDSTTRPATLRLQVVLRTGVKRPATLLEQGHMRLIGETDLGEYSLDLHKIRLIVPVR